MTRGSSGPRAGASTPTCGSRPTGRHTSTPRRSASAATATCAPNASRSRGNDANGSASGAVSTSTNEEAPTMTAGACSLLLEVDDLDPQAEGLEVLPQLPEPLERGAQSFVNGISVFGIVRLKMTTLRFCFLLIAAPLLVGMVRAPRGVEPRRGPSARAGLESFLLLCRWFALRALQGVEPWRGPSARAGLRSLRRRTRSRCLISCRTLCSAGRCRTPRPG
jgi:hypothetical protein